MAIWPILAHQAEEYRIIKADTIFMVEFKSYSLYSTSFCGNYWRVGTEFTSLEDAVNAANDHLEDCRIDKEGRVKGYPYITLDAIKLKEDDKIDEYVRWLENKLIEVSSAYDRIKYGDD